MRFIDSYIVPIHSLPSNAASGSKVIYVNRQSWHLNQHGHQVRNPKLKGAHSRLTPNEPYALQTFTGSGHLSIVRKALAAEKKLKGTYFDGLLNLLKNVTKNVPFGQKLYVVFHSIDWLFRPTRYRSTVKKMWDDYKYTRFIIATFRWGVEHDLVEESTWGTLKVIRSLPKGYAGTFDHGMGICP